MPIYSFVCEGGHEEELLLKVEELEEERVCKVCGKPLEHKFSGDYKLRFSDRFSESTRPKKLV